MLCVAVAATLSPCRTLPAPQHPRSVYGFATPALGNNALAATVAECGWDRRIRNYINPDDPIPRLLNRRQLAASEAAAAAAAAAAAPAPAPAAAAAALEKEEASSEGEAPRPAAVAQAAVLATAAAAAAVTGAAPADAGSVNNIQAASRLVGAQQRLHRVAGDGGSSSNGALVAEAPVGLLAGVRSLARSASAPALLGAPEAAASEAAAATSAAVPAAVLGQQGQAAVDAAAAAAAAAAEASSTAAAMSGKPPGSGLRWRWGPPLRRVGSAALAAAAPPVRAAVERAGSAARMVAVPLSAAASVPMRAAPQYLPLGRQLYILAGQHVSDTKPSSSSRDGTPASALAAAAAAVAPGAAAPATPRRLPWSPFWRREPAAEPAGGSEDEEDNVDVAAAQRLAAAGTAGAAGGSLASASLDDGPIPGTQQQPRGVFAAHRMATYRHRLLCICQGGCCLAAFAWAAWHKVGWCLVYSARSYRRAASLCRGAVRCGR